MKKGIVALMLLLASSVSYSGNDEWKLVDASSKQAQYKVLDVRDDLKMFSFIFAFDDEANDRYYFSSWYVKCDTGETSAFHHTTVERSTRAVLEDEEHPPQWGNFNERGNGWVIQMRECGAMADRLKAAQLKEKEV